MIYVFKPSENIKKKMIDFYKDKTKDKNPPYSVFQANDADTTITLYESGKVVFQGKDADLSSDFWITTEKLNSGDVSVKSSETKKKDKLDKVSSVNPIFITLLALVLTKLVLVIILVL